MFDLTPQILKTNAQIAFELMLFTESEKGGMYDKEYWFDRYRECVKVVSEAEKKSQELVPELGPPPELPQVQG